MRKPFVIHYGHSFAVVQLLNAAQLTCEDAAGAVGVVDLVPNDILAVFLCFHLFTTTDGQDRGVTAVCYGGPAQEQTQYLPAPPSWGAVSSEMGVSPSSGGAVFSTEAEDSTACSSAAGASAESSFSPCTGSSTGAAFFRRGARLVLREPAPQQFRNHLRWGAICTFSRQIGRSLSSPSPSSPAADPAGSSESEGAPEAVPSSSGAASSDASVSINSRGRVRAFQSGVAIRLICRGAVIGPIHRGQQRTQIVTVRRRRRISRGPAEEMVPSAGRCFQEQEFPAPAILFSWLP